MTVGLTSNFGECAYLLNDRGRHRLRAEGFAAIVFDDHTIVVVWWLQREVPTIARLRVPSQVVRLHDAA